MTFNSPFGVRGLYILPFKALNTQAIAKNPIPTEANPQPAMSLYRKAPSAIRPTPTTSIINVAQAKTVFLFILYCSLLINFPK